MKSTRKFIAAAWLTTLLLMTVALSAQSSQQYSAPAADGTRAAATAKVSDLAFLAGRWTGTVDSNQIHQECSVTDPEMMLCMFWMTDSKGTQMIELYTLRNSASGVVERVRFLSPELTEEANDKGLTMKLISYSPKQMVFENPNGTYPKRSTLTRVGEDQFTSRIELVDANGKESLIEAHWTKQ